MMRLHALQSINIGATAFEVYLSGLSDEASLDLASRPKGMAHRSPWLGWVGTVE